MFFGCNGQDRRGPVPDRRMAFWHRQSTPSPTPPQENLSALTGDNLVGRKKELERLHQRLAAAEPGGFKLLEIAGKAGIGKASLVETFIEILDVGVYWKEFKLSAHANIRRLSLSAPPALQPRWRAWPSAEGHERLWSGLTTQLFCPHSHYLCPSSGIILSTIRRYIARICFMKNE